MGEPTAGEGQTSVRIGEVDGLRGLAVSLILLLHLYILPHKSEVLELSPRLWALLEKATCGVDLFFVISGFLIGGILLDERDSPRLLGVFYRRRACRILPLFYLLVAFAYLPYLIPGLDVGSPEVPAAAYLLFVNNFWTATGHMYPIALGIAWSLAIEEQFYVVSPAFVKIAPASAIRGALVLGVLGPPLIRGMLAWSGSRLSIYELTFCRVDGICLGFLAALWLRDPKSRGILVRLTRHGPVILALAAAGFVAGSQLSLVPSAALLSTALWPSYVAISGTVILLVSVLHPGRALASWLRQAPLVALGRYSYFLYLFHLCFAGLTAESLAELLPNRFLNRSLALALTLGAAMVSYRYLESPLIRWSRRVPYREPATT